MPDNTNNGGLSLEALLAAARGVQEEATEAQPVVSPEPAPTPAATPQQPAVSTASAPQAGASAAAGAAAAGTSAAGVQAASTARTASAEPVAEPSAAVQEEALEQAEARDEAPVFDLAAALGYGRRESEPEPANEPEEKFDLAAALGYKSQEVREREAAEAAAAEAAAQAQAVQEQAYREAERLAQVGESARRDHDTQPTRAERVDQAAQPTPVTQAVQPTPTTQEAQAAQAQVAQEQPVRAEAAERAKQPEPERADQTQQPEAERVDRTLRPQAAQAQPAAAEDQPARGEREVASVRKSDAPQVRSRSFEATKTATVSPEERYAAKSAAAQSATGSDGITIESYQPTKRDRSAQARAARPLKKAEVSEVAQAIAAQNAATEFVEEIVEEKPVEKKTETVVSEAKTEAKEVESAAEEKPAAARTAASEPVAEPSAAVQEKAFEKAEARFTEKSEMKAASVAKEAEPPRTEPVLVAEIPATSQPKTAEPAPAPVGQPLPVIPPAEPVKPVTMPHKVPVRTTEEVIRPTQPPVKLGVISPEAARHEAATKKKVQSTERKIVKKVRRFRTLGMFLIVLALAALAGAIFLFVAGNAQANESIEAEATEICEQAGRTITYRYKAADSNGTLCPTTEVATFSAGDVLEQSVITMNTPDFETAGHTLANFKKQFEKSSYVDGRVDGSTVIFTLHMSNERIMKVTYTALLMKNTTGCEVIL